MIIKTQNKSVIDNTQSIKLDTETEVITVASYCGRHKVYLYSFKVKDYLTYGDSFSPEWNQSQFLDKHPANKDDSEFNPLRERILDAQRYAINEAIIKYREVKDE